MAGQLGDSLAEMKEPLLGKNLVAPMAAMMAEPMVEHLAGMKATMWAVLLAHSMVAHLAVSRADHLEPKLVLH